MRFSLRLCAAACFCAALALGCNKTAPTEPAPAPGAHSDVKVGGKKPGKPDLPQPPPPPPR